MDFGNLLINIVLTAFCYLCVPTCFLLMFSAFGKKLSKKAIWTIVIVNGIVMWLIMQVIQINRGIEGTSAAVFPWSAVAYWMLTKKLLKEE